MKYKALHYLSVAGVYMMLYGFIYIIQNISFGWISPLNKVLFDIFPLKFIVFTIISIIIISKFFKISSPYKDEFSSS